MTALTDQTTREAPRGHDAGAAGACGDDARQDRPRANTGRHTPADDIRAEEARAKLEDFAELRRARGAAEAGILRLLATVYEIAMDRTLAAIEDAFATGSQEKVFSWHFTSLLSDFAIKTNESPRALTNKGHDAYELVTHFPDWVASIEAGRIDVAHARAMLREKDPIKEEQYKAFSDALLPLAEQHTASKTRTEAARVASILGAVEFEESCARARAARFVSVTHDAFGMATIHAYVPGELAIAVKDLLDQQAKEILEANKAAKKAAAAESAAAAADAATGVSGAETSEPGVAATEADPAATDNRTMDQIRADLFVETILCATPGESRVTTTVNLTIPALTLLEGRVNGSAPALLNGMLPMSFEAARQLTANATAFRRVLTDPVHGHVTAVDTYAPTVAMRRFIQIRDRQCRFPGCTRPATRSEIDHTHPASEGGATSTDNLAVLCKSHHVLKHEKPWTVTNLGDGELEWRTPLGQVVTSQPMPYTPTTDRPEFRPTTQESSPTDPAASFGDQFSEFADIMGAAFPDAEKWSEGFEESEDYPNDDTPPF